MIYFKGFLWKQERVSDLSDLYHIPSYLASEWGRTDQSDYSDLSLCFSKIKPLPSM